MAIQSTVCPRCGSKMMQPAKGLPLTDRQEDILSFIRSSIKRNNFAPTLEEIGAECDIGVSTVWKHVSNLEAKGYLRRARNRARMMEVV